MHRAPALSLTLVPDRAWHRAMQGLSVAALVTALFWLGWHVQQTGGIGPLRLVVAAACVASAFRAWRQPALAADRPLVWQPTAHHWLLQTRAGQLDCLVDLGHWMLLRHRAQGGQATWLPVSRRDHAPHWHALRCALFNPGTPVDSPSPLPPADE
jgi:L-ascorbate metabolism protein UlaG (beta-lactamase superfamily)